MSGVAEETRALNTTRAAKSSQNIMTPVGAQPAYTVKSSEPETEDDCEPDSPEVKAEKSVADRIREKRDGKDSHVRGFLRAFYAARALERSKRQA
jgi:hypothetical protein